MVEITINELHDIVHDRFLTELTPSEVQDYIRVLEMRHAIMKDEIVALRKQKESLEKALDKASKKLSEYERQYNYLCGNMNSRYPAYWKEWCMSDE